MHHRFFLAALGLAASLAAAAAPAEAENLFTVSGIHVEAAAASATEARNSAIAAGRAEAWQVLFRRLTREEDWPRQPALDPAALQKLTTAFIPAGERRSTTRYVAEVAYVFNPHAVAKLLQASGIAYATASARRVLVIPLSPAYARAGGWTDALANPRFANSIVPFVLPLGDAADKAALAGLSFEAARWADIAPEAARRGAKEAVLMLATASGDKMTVTLRRLGPSEMSTKATAEVPLTQSAASTYPAAAVAAVRAMEDMWKSRTALDFGRKGTLTVDATVRSLEEFSALEAKLSALPNVAAISVAAMDIGAARLSVSYLGSVEQLKDALKQAGLTLTATGGIWHLSAGARGS
jgi:hypothetical protein